MGINDREYIRTAPAAGIFGGEGGGTKLLIAVNVGVFLVLTIFDQGALLNWLDLNSPALFRGGQVWRLLTHAFVHIEPIHLIFNMLFLWMMGRDVESIYGRRDLFGLYVMAALASGLVWAVIDYFGMPDGPSAGAIGASGAVMAITVVCAIYHPTREILFMMFVPMQLWLAVVLYLGFDLFNLATEMKGNLPGASVAFAGHLGGGAFGYLFKEFDLRWTKWGLNRLFRPRLKVYRDRDPAKGRERTTTRTSAPVPSAVAASGPSAMKGSRGSATDEALDARLDQVLEKIAREGRESLTTDEKEILDAASRRARDRRRDRS